MVDASYEAQMIQDTDMGDDQNGVFIDQRSPFLNLRKLDWAWTQGLIWFAMVLSPIVIEWALSWDEMTLRFVLCSAGACFICWFLRLAKAAS